MTHRERVLAALNHEEPDRVPMDLGGCLASGVVGHGYPKLRAALGLAVDKTQETWRYTSLAQIDPEVRTALDVDIIHAPLTFGSSKYLKVLSGDRYVDEWGIQWHKPDQGHYYVERAPFETEATVQAVDKFAWPEKERIVHVDGLRGAIEKLRSESDHAISLELRGRVMSMGQFLRGFENWMMDLADNEPFVQALLEKTTQIQMECNEIILSQVGDLVDIVYTSDDLGGQGGPLLSPAAYKRLFRPFFKQLWNHARSKTPAKLMHHCCGSIYPFIAGFIDLGIQALNPIQVSAVNMDPMRLKAEFGKHLTFWGGVDTRYVMPRGTVEEVRAEVRLRIKQMGREGYILAAVHNLQPEVPGENIIAMFRAGKEEGRA